MKVAIVTPSIGTEHFKQCVESVQYQTYDDIVHYIFIDGERYSEKIENVLNPIVISENYQHIIETISLSENIGKGWYGHRAYAACSFLVNADIICYLDEDNWLEPYHVKKLVEIIKKGNDWAYSLRKIFNKEGKFLCRDNCESLGKWPVYFDASINHIDTSCFAVRREVAVAIGHSWYGQWGADRQFFGALQKYFPKYGCSGDYTLCYRLDGNPNSVSQEFFDNGNEINKIKYNNKFPWRFDER
jgi:hypothetical protein